MSLKKIEDALTVLGYKGEIVGFDLASEEGYCIVKLKVSPSSPSPVAIDISKNTFCGCHVESQEKSGECTDEDKNGICIKNTKMIFRSNLAGDPNKDVFKSDAKRCNIVIPDDDVYKLKSIGFPVKETVSIPRVNFINCFVIPETNKNFQTSIYFNGQLVDRKDYYTIDEATVEEVECAKLRMAVVYRNGDPISKMYIKELRLKGKIVDPWEGLASALDSGVTTIEETATDEVKEETTSAEKSRWKTPKPRTAMRYVYFKKEKQAKDFAKEYEKDFEYAAGQTLGKDSLQKYKIRKNHSDNDLYTQGYMWSLEFRMNGKDFQVLEQCENLKKKTTGNRAGHCVRYKED